MEVTYNIELDLDCTGKRLVGKMKAYIPEQHSKNCILRIDNNYVLNRAIYSEEDMKMVITSIKDQCNKKIDYELILTKCGKEFYRINNVKGMIEVNYYIKIRTFDHIIRFEDSIYGGIACYPRIIDEHTRFFCVDCVKANYSVKINVPISAVVYTSGRMTRCVYNKKKLYFILEKAIGFGMIIAFGVGNIARIAYNIELNMLYFEDNKAIYDKTFAKRIESIVEENIFKLENAFFSFPTKHITIVPGIPFLRGGYVSEGILFLNYVDFETISEENLGNLIMHELAHFYFGIYFNDDCFYGKCIGKGLSMWAEEKINGKNYYNESIAIDEKISIFPICYYQRTNIQYDWNTNIYHIQAFELIKRIESLIGEKIFIQKLLALMNHSNGKVIYYDEFLKRMGVEYLMDSFVNVVDVEQCRDNICQIE